MTRPIDVMAANPMTLTCTECGDLFTRTLAEQRYYDHHVAQPPETCPPCRTQRRAARNAELRAAHTSGSHEALAPSPAFRAGGDGGRRAGPGPSGGPGGEVRLFQAVCAECGRATEVPFRPRSGRPVFCRDCYNARQGR
ncbi:MAG: hypothetical protein AVDCRST_MAG33-1231 [uncultured Thermomicrobiales bacterium]|uniref:C2H2-type domain-containing protein n=1 Tax=uncultured Thermomicrobiales bacterium TaxID=1645740 RepID=A0A6J4UQA4_9BACT|nr:MAG: hypothetical protein AVDCRST_MAG33-1231 [uncultured Thermomicrobiales bacterium]